MGYIRKMKVGISESQASRRIQRLGGVYVRSSDQWACVPANTNLSSNRMRYKNGRSTVNIIGAGGSENEDNSTIISPAKYNPM